MKKLFFAMMAIFLACSTTKKSEVHPEQSATQRESPRTPGRPPHSELLQVSFKYWPDTKFLRMMTQVGESWEILEVKVKTGEKTHNISKDPEKDQTGVPGPFHWEDTVLTDCPIAEVTSSKSSRSGMFIRYDSTCEDVFSFDLK